jgi:hypothetical protein
VQPYFYMQFKTTEGEREKIEMTLKYSGLAEMSCKSYDEQNLIFQ